MINIQCESELLDPVNQLQRELGKAMEQPQRDRVITIMVGVLIGIGLMTLFYLTNMGPE